MEGDIHIYMEAGQYMMLSASIDEVADYFYNHSPFAHSNYQRLEEDLVRNFQDFNHALIHKNIPDEEFSQECLRIIIQYHFMPGILGVDVENERELFTGYMRQEYHVKDPLAVHFQVDDSERFPVENIAHIFFTHEIFRHKTPHGLRDRIHHQATIEISKLEKHYSLEQVLVTIGFCYVLCPAFGFKADEFKKRFYKATEGQPTYVIVMPWEIETEEE